MSRIYVGNLPLDIRESELDDLFYKYGKIREIDLKTPSRPPAFAFISFDDYRDAQDAIRGRDGYNFDGYRLRVESSKGDRGRGGAGAAEPRRGGRRTEWTVQVTNLPRGCSWQDLKDFMRKIGDVVFTDVERNGEGVVDFSNREDMEEAIRRLDDTEFKSYTDTSYIRVRAAKKRDRSEEPRREARRDRSPSPRGRSPSPRGRSPSPRDRSRSRERSAPRRRDSEDHQDNHKTEAPREEENAARED